MWADNTICQLTQHNPRSSVDRDQSIKALSQTYTVDHGSEGNNQVETKQIRESGRDNQVRESGRDIWEDEVKGWEHNAQHMGAASS